MPQLFKNYSFKVQQEKFVNTFLHKNVHVEEDMERFTYLKALIAFIHITFYSKI